MTVWTEKHGTEKNVFRASVSQIYHARNAVQCMYVYICGCICICEKYIQKNVSLLCRILKCELMQLF